MPKHPVSKPLHVACLIALAAALLLSSPQASRAETISVTALDLESRPVAGVVLRVTAKDKEAVSLLTDERGVAQFEVASTNPGDFELKLADERYSLVDEGRGGRMVFLQLLPVDLKLLSPYEVMRLAEMQPAILRRELESGDKLEGSAAEPGALRLSVFLRGRRPQPRSRDDLPRIGPNHAEVSMNVVDEYGRPAAGRNVSLLTFNEEVRELELVIRERSDESGRVTFRDVPPERLYRAEIDESGDGRTAIGEFFVPGRRERRQVASLALRAPERVVSLIVVDGKAPVPGARVRLGGTGQPRLEATTDSFGHAQLAPVPAGELLLTVQEPGGATHEWKATPGSEDLVPLDLLRLAADRRLAEEQRDRDELERLRAEQQAVEQKAYDEMMKRSGDSLGKIETPSGS